MKNLLAFDSVAGTYDGEPLVARRLEGESKTKYGELQQERARFARYALPPKWVQLLITISMLVGMGLLLLALEFISQDKVTSQMKQVALVLACIGGPFFLLGLAGIVWMAIRTKKLYNSSDYRFFEERERKVLAGFCEELGVPETAIAVDAFVYRYRIKNGKVKYEAPASKYCYVNAAVLVYADTDAFFIAAEDTVFRIPFASSPKIERIEKRKAFYGWNKQEKPNKDIYKQYKIRSNDSGALTVKPYYALRVYASGEDYEFLFPPYEYETISRLTGRTA